MPLNQIGSGSTANVGTYNDVGGNQVNVQGDLIGQLLCLFNLSA